MVELGVPDAVPKVGLAEVKEVAEKVGADPEMLHRAVRYVTGFGVFEEHADGKMSHTEISLKLCKGGALRNKVLFRASRESVLPYIDGFTRALKDPTKSGFEHAFGEDYLMKWLPKHSDSEVLFGEYMSEASSAQIPAILDAYPWPTEGTIADIGGGNGHLLRALLTKSPKTSGVLFDLPSAIANAEFHWPEGDVMRSERVTFVGGDFFVAVDVDADVYVIKWILHDWDDSKCTTLLSNIHVRAKSGAVVVIIDMLVPDDLPNTYHVSKFFDMHMAAGFGGKERTASQMKTIADSAGWAMAEVRRVGVSPFSCCVLRKSH